MSEAIDRLRAEIEEKAPELDCNKCLPSEKTWREHMNNIRRHIIDGDPARFLAWQPIISTMAGIGHGDWCVALRRYLEELSDWKSRWRFATEEVPTGGALRYFGESPRSSIALLSAACCLVQFEQNAKMNVENLSFIFEFGGGYGCLRRLLDTLGFRGQYVDFDFPVMTALKRFYLTQTGVYESGKSNLLLSDWDQLTSVLKKVPKNSLFISNWALSETPLTLRARVLSLIGKFEHFLVVYQPSFQEVDNEHYFSEFRRSLRGVNWYSWEMPGPGSKVVVGVRRGDDELG